LTAVAADAADGQARMKGTCSWRSRCWRLRRLRKRLTRAVSMLAAALCIPAWIPRTPPWIAWMVCGALASRRMLVPA